MSKLPAKVLYIIGALLAFLIVGGTYQFVVQPSLASSKEAEEQITLAKNKSNELDSSIAMLKSQAADIEKTEAEIGELTSTFPTTYKQAEWITLMYEAAKSADVTVITLDPGLPADPATVTDTTEGNPLFPTLATIPGSPVAPVVPGTTPVPPVEGGVVSPIAVSKIVMEVTGDAANVVQFLQNLENLSRPLRITNLKIGGEGEVSVEIIGRTYLSRPVTAPADPNAAPAPVPAS